MLIELVVLIVAATGSASHQSLDAAAAALADFRPQEALTLLERAGSEGPYDWQHHVLLQEQLGIANAYLGRSDAALDAFDRLLALDPRHAVSYTLSPKVTFLFEKAREKANARGAPALELSWPGELTVSDPIPIEVQIASDPLASFSRAILYYRVRGEVAYTPIEFELSGRGKRARLVLPPPGGQREATVEIHLVARDARGNETYLWYSPEKPRDIALAYEPADPWYSTWWVWAIAGGAVAAAGVGAALIAGHEPDRYVGGGFELR